MTVVEETFVEAGGPAGPAGPAASVAPESVPPAPEQPRRIGGVSRSAVLSLTGAAASALCVTILLFGELAPFSGTLGFAVTAYVVFLTVYAVLTGFEEDGQAVRDRVMTVVLWTAASLLFSALALVVGFTAWRGKEALPHGNFFTQDMQATGPLDPLTMGGIAHAMAGTLIMMAIALTITVPLGLACAVYLNQIPGRFSRFVRTIVEAMTALPSIVAGLMVYAVWILGLGMQKSGLAAGFAISVMMLPIVIRASDVVLRLVPGTLTEAAEALGAPRWRTVWHVVLPTARSGLATAVILGTARGIGETSPVLLTAGFTAALNADPTSGPMVSLPLAVFNFVKSPQPEMIARGFGAAAVLMAMVLVLFVIARVIGGRGPGHQTRRQARRTARASRRDVARFTELHEQGPGLSLFDAASSDGGITSQRLPARETEAAADGGYVPQGPPAPGPAAATDAWAAPEEPTVPAPAAVAGSEAATQWPSAPDPAAAADGEAAPQEPPTPAPAAAAADGEQAAQGRPAPAPAAAAADGEQAAQGRPAPAPAAAAANGESAPQGPPAPDDESSTGGAGGINNPAEGRETTHRPAPADAPAPTPTPTPAPGETD